MNAAQVTANLIEIHNNEGNKILQNPNSTQEERDRAARHFACVGILIGDVPKESIYRLAKERKAKEAPAPNLPAHIWN